MVIFVSQSPVFPVGVVLLLLIPLFEMIGLKTRINILILSLVAMLSLFAAYLTSAVDVTIPELLYAIGVALSFILALYSMATARRGKQWPWFVFVLLIAAITLICSTVARAALEEDFGDSSISIVTFVLAFLPAVSTLLYGLFAPDISKPRGAMR